MGEPSATSCDMTLCVEYAPASLPARLKHIADEGSGHSIQEHAGLRPCCTNQPAGMFSSMRGFAEYLAAGLVSVTHNHHLPGLL